MCAICRKLHQANGGETVWKRDVKCCNKELIRGLNENHREKKDFHLSVLIVETLFN